MMNVKTLLGASVLALGFSASVASAANINLPYSPLPSFLGAYVAQEEGIFAKHGLTVNLVFTPANGQATAALAGGSADIGTVPPTALIQAAANGLDVVAIAGSEAFPLKTKSGMVVKADGPVKTAADLAGKKLAVPGLNGTSDLLLRKYLKANKITGTSIVEIGIALTGDAVKQGTVDSAFVPEPFLSRLMNAGGYASVADIMTGPAGVPVIVYAATRDWAAKNADTLKEFRAALAEGTAFAMDPKNEAKVRAALAKYTKLPDPVVASLVLPGLDTKVSAAGVDFWVQAMVEAGWLDKPVAASAIVLP